MTALRKLKASHQNTKEFLCCGIDIYISTKVQREITLLGVEVHKQSQSQKPSGTNIFLHRLLRVSQRKTSLSTMLYLCQQKKESDSSTKSQKIRTWDSSLKNHMNLLTPSPEISTPEDKLALEYDVSRRQNQTL